MIEIITRQKFTKITMVTNYLQCDVIVILMIFDSQLSSVSVRELYRSQVGLSPGTYFTILLEYN